ncbi:MAG: UDP-N-acetylglucosamine 1-carboxyvinyltransferase [Lachnospirales bacterium]
MKYVVDGGKELNGEVKISGAKNAVLPILASLVLVGECQLKNIPKLSDVAYTEDILNHIKFSNTIPFDLSNKMRSSILFVGSMLGARGEVTICYPGGCQIGKRPVDMHISVLRKLGAEIKVNENIIIAKAKKLKGCKIKLPFVSVGVTENIILASVCAEGVTVIENAAIEPEIYDLISFLNMCGGNIKSKGRTIYIKGVKKLNPITYNIMPDRIEAVTYILMGAITGGELFIENIKPSLISNPIKILKSMGIIVKETDTGLYIDSPKRLKAIHHFQTSPYPGIPTDIQPQLSSALCVSEGVSKVKENIFSNRTSHIEELNKMGADIIKLSEKEYIINGVKNLNPSHINAYDLRGGAALVCAALKAEGKSIIENTHHIKRGYELFTEKIKLIGGDIKEIP